MDPLSGALAFSTIVSLIGMYRSESRSDEAESYENFLAWLRTHRHDQLVKLLADNTNLSESTKRTIEANHQTIMEQLSDLNAIMCGIATKFDGFEDLATAIGVESQISDQAVSVLRQMNESNCSRFLESKTQGGVDYIMMDGKRGEIAMSDSRFIEDDLGQLDLFDLLRLDYNGSGSRIFHITRAGAKVGERASHAE